MLQIPGLPAPETSPEAWAAPADHLCLVPHERPGRVATTLPGKSSVSLRPLTLEDDVTIAGWAADPVFCRAADWTVGLPPSDYVAFQAGLITKPPTDLVRLGAALGGRLVGYVALQGVEVGRRELGFVIGERTLWGRGLGTAAASAGLRHGFASMRLSDIWAEALAANGASVRILENLGMRETGVGEHGTYLGQPSQYRQFTISSAEFEPRRRSSGSRSLRSGRRVPSRMTSSTGWFHPSAGC